MPVHHTLEEYLDSYIAAAGIKEDPKSPLFRASNGKTKILSDRPLDREDAFHMVRRRARQAGIETKIGCHTFRATGITIYLTNGPLGRLGVLHPTNETAVASTAATRTTLCI